MGRQRRGMYNKKTSISKIELLDKDLLDHFKVSSMILIFKDLFLQFLLAHLMLKSYV
jgi:hypothetical protein